MNLYRIESNTGQFGNGRGNWLLVSADGRLISHCDLHFKLEDSMERLHRLARHGERQLFKPRTLAA